MSKQPRQPKKPRSDAPAKRKATEREEQGAAPATDEPKARGSVTLPAFGFAKDLLAEAAASADQNADNGGGEDADLDGPERIFAFADQLSAASAQEQKEAEARAQRLETWITFILSDEVYALPITPVREALRVGSITRVPHAPQPIRGVTNLRGRVLPVIDLRLRIGLRSVELGRSNRILVVRARNRHLGLLVDAVLQVVHIDLNRAEPPPEDVMTAQSDYITGVYHHGEQLILLLDVERALIIQEASSAA